MIENVGALDQQRQNWREKAIGIRNLQNVIGGRTAANATKTATMASFSTFVRRAPIPAVAAYLSQTKWSSCEAEQPARNSQQAETFPGTTAKVENKVSAAPKTAGLKPSEEGDYHGLFPKSQLWQPKKEYPLWDDDWDGRKPESTGDKTADRERQRHIRKHGVTR